MAFSAGTALTGFMGGMGQGIQNNAMLQALQDQQRKRQAQGLAFQALLAGALGNTGGLPDGGAPPVPTGATAGAGGIPMPQAPAPVPQPSMPGTDSNAPGAGGLNTPVPVPPMAGPPPPVGAGGPLPMRGGMGLDFENDNPGDYIEPPPAPAPAPSAPPASAPAPAAQPEAAPPSQSQTPPAPQAQAPFPQPEQATHLDFSRFFHTVDPQHLAEAVMKVKPGVDPQTAMIAVNELYKMGTQGSKLEQAQTALIMNSLYKQGALNLRAAGLQETERSHQANEGQRQQTINATAANRQRLGEQFQQKEQRLTQQQLDRLARSTDPTIRSKAAALRAQKQQIIDASRNSFGQVAPSEEQTAQIVAIDKMIAELYTRDVRRMGGEMPQGTLPMQPSAPLQ